MKKGLILSVLGSTVSLLAAVVLFCSFSRPQPDYQEYEDFIEAFYKNGTNESFEQIEKHFYDERSCVDISILYHFADSKFHTDRSMVFYDSEEKEKSRADDFLGTLGKFIDFQIVSESVEDIYDIPVGSLYCFECKVKYENFEASEYFWLREKDGKVSVYRYGTGIDVFCNDKDFTDVAASEVKIKYLVSCIEKNLAGTSVLSLFQKEQKNWELYRKSHLEILFPEYINGIKMLCGSEESYKLGEETQRLNNERIKVLEAYIQRDSGTDGKGEFKEYVEELRRIKSSDQN